MAGKRSFRSKLIRVLRDLGIVSVMCGLFFGVSYYFSQPNSPTEMVTESETTKILNAANKSLRNRDWKQAEAEFKKLISLDPYDGASVMRLANHYYLRRQASWVRIYRLRRSVEADSEEEQKCWDEAAQYRELAIEAYEKLTEFGRYRGEAYTSLAQIYSTQSRIEGPEQTAQKQKALGYLKKLVDEGYCTVRGISRTRDFEYIAKEPGFREICLQEQKIVETDPYYSSRRRENWANLMGVPSNMH